MKKINNYNRIERTPDSSAEKVLGGDFYTRSAR